MTIQQFNYIEYHILRNYLILCVNLYCLVNNEILSQYDYADLFFEAMFILFGQISEMTLGSFFP